MEKASDGKKAHFTYLWVMENVSSWHLSKAYRSSIFTIDSMEKTKWQLTMDLATTWIAFYIQRADEDDGPDSIQIDYEISFVGGDGLPMAKKIAGRKQFEHSSYCSIRGFEKTEDVFFHRKEEFLTNDNLAVRFRMWRTGTAMSKSALCFVRTRKSIDRLSFVWKIRDFSTLRPKEKRVHYINPPTKEAPRIILTFYLCEKMGKEYAFIDINRSIKTKCHAIFGKISLLDANGRPVKSSKLEECVSGSYETICLIKQCFKKSDFTSDKESLLPNDVLSLRCEFDIDVDPTWDQIESYMDFESNLPEIPEIHFDDEKVETCMSSCSMRNFFRTCYEEGTLIDVCLQAGSKTFPVHRAMLSIRSPVFKAMFTKEKKTVECIKISGIGEDTLSHMLSYIYTNSVPELKWNEVVNLYKAADEYELLDLREICSNFLKVNVSLAEFCSALVLADEHQDQGLQNVLHNYVFIHSDQIFDSKEWKEFRISEPVLAMTATESIICSIKDEEIYYICPDEDDKFDSFHSPSISDDKEIRVSERKHYNNTNSGHYVSLL